MSDKSSSIIKEQEYDLFGRKQISIPTPKFVVFYNGLEKRHNFQEHRTKFIKYITNHQGQE